MLKTREKQEKRGKTRKIVEIKKKSWTEKCYQELMSCGTLMP